MLFCVNSLFYFTVRGKIQQRIYMFIYCNELAIQVWRKNYIFRHITEKLKAFILEC